MLEMDNPKVRKIVDTYKKILEVYQAVKPINTVKWKTTPGFGFTSGLILNFTHSSSTNISF